MIMKKSRLVGVAFMAVFAFLAISATSAFAAAEWLVEGNALSAAMPAETEGSLKLLTFNKGVEENSITCGGIFDGTIGPGAEDSIAKLLNASMEEISLSIPRALICPVTVDKTSALNCKAGENAEVYPANMPWPTLLELMTTNVLDLISKEPGYEVKCKTLTGLTGESTCVAKAGSSTFNSNEENGDPTAVLGVFNNESEPGVCTVTGFAAGEEGDGNTWAIGAELVRLKTQVDE